MTTVHTRTALPAAATAATGSNNSIGKTGTAAADIRTAAAAGTV
jgi:hypothetical protein